jgi:cytoskeleton protein RodZ
MKFTPGRSTAGDGLQREQLTGAPDESSKSLGAVLRVAREARAMTVSEVAGQIRIPAGYLTTLETGDYSGIANELYLLPYLRDYARFLGLNASALSARFIGGIESTGRFADPLIELLDEEPPSRRGGWSTTVVLLLFVALAIYLVGSW